MRAASEPKKEIIVVPLAVVMPGPKPWPSVSVGRPQRRPVGGGRLRSDWLQHLLSVGSWGPSRSLNLELFI